MVATAICVAPGLKIDVSHVFLYLIFPLHTLYFSYPHFTDQKIEALTGYVFYLKSQ